MPKLNPITTRKKTLIFILICAFFQTVWTTCYTTSNPLHATDRETTYTLPGQPYNPGFFSAFDSVLGALDFFDSTEFCKGLEVDFQKRGLYYDPAYGTNWWNYYFEPIHLSKDPCESTRTILAYEQIMLSLYAQFDMPDERGHELIQKYIKLTQPLQEKLDAFVETHFKDTFVIGIHYRGTDKKSEAPEVEYATIPKLISEELLNHPNAKIFVATDEAPFLEFMQGTFPEKIIALDAIRSADKTPVHVTTHNNGYTDQDCYKKGEDAIPDCILLSKCSKLYKMASNLSDASLKFNPLIPVVHLNKSYFEDVVKKQYGLVTTLNTILALLSKYEQSESDGLSANVLLDTNQNWWDILFEPLTVGTDPQPAHVSSKDNYLIGLRNLMHMSPEEAHRLIKKYIRIKQEIIQEVETFAQKNFQNNHVVSLFYVKQPAGIIETIQPTLEPDTVITQLKEYLQTAPQNTKLFLVTRHKAFFDRMIAEFPDTIYFYTPNPGQPMSGIENTLLEGKHCLLLSKTNRIIGTDSGVLRLVHQFNPTVTIASLDTWYLGAA